MWAASRLSTRIALRHAWELMVQNAVETARYDFARRIKSSLARIGAPVTKPDRVTQWWGPDPAPTRRLPPVERAPTETDSVSDRIVVWLQDNHRRGGKMYLHILLAYDGTLEGRLALREGARLAQVSGARVTLMAVVDPGYGIGLAADPIGAYFPPIRPNCIKRFWTKVSSGCDIWA